MRRLRPGLAVELAILGLVVGVASVVYARALPTALSYDEGNYLASLDALRHGQALGRDVFLDQPPGWYLLLQGIAALLGEGVTAVRLALMGIALLGLVAAWAAARALGGPVAGLGAAAALSVAPPYPTLAATVESDPPATVLALVSLALMLCAGRRRWMSCAAGVVFALAVSVKLFAVAAAPPLAAITWRRRREDGPWAHATWCVSGFGAVVVGIVVGYRHVLHQLWRGVFGAHLNARSGPQLSGASNLSRIVHLPDLHTPFGWIAWCGLALATVWLARRRPLGLWPLWLFALAAALFTLVMRPLLDHHLVLLATALAVPAGAAVALTLARLPRWSLVVLVLFVAAGLYQENRRLARNARPAPPDYRWATEVVARRTSPSELVVSDIPSIPYLAGRRQPGQLIDTSVARIVDEYLKPSEVLRLIDESHAPIVVVGRNFRSQPEILRGLAERYSRRLRHGEITLYMRSG